MEAWLDLRPFMFRSPLLVQGGASLTRALVLFRGLGLRHLLVAPQDPRSVGIITRKARCCSPPTRLMRTYRTRGSIPVAWVLPIHVLTTVIICCALGRCRGLLSNLAGLGAQDLTLENAQLVLAQQRAGARTSGPAAPHAPAKHPTPAQEAERARPSFSVRPANSPHARSPHTPAAGAAKQSVCQSGSAV